MNDQNRHDAAGGAQTLVTRRRFLYGAAGVGAAAVLGIGAAVASRPRDDEGPTLDVGDEKVPVLEVPESALTTLNDLEALESAEGQVQLVGNYDLPFGTLLWVNDDSVAACLLPTETGSPLTQVGLFALGSGTMTTALAQAVGSDERYEIYDVRATSSGMIWTEANVMEGTWRVYAAKTSGNSPGTPRLLEEGDATYDTPTLAACGTRGFWQVLPKAPNTEGIPSRLMGTTFGKKDDAVVYESARRMGTPPYSADGSVVITPRVDSPTVYYQLTNIEAKTGTVTDQLILPHGMLPLEAGYGANGFSFSFPDIYDYGDAISNLGTYTPLEKPGEGGYGKVRWFGFARTPSAPPAWCKNLLVIKSSYSVCGVDLAAGTYFAIDVDDGADNYGEYLATSGTHNTFVTYANIDHTPVSGDATHACRVKVWSVLSEASRRAAAQNDDADLDEDSYGEDSEGGDSLAPQTVEITDLSSQSVQA